MSTEICTERKVDDPQNKNKLEIRLPDTRGVTISRWGGGNLKIGLGVITYSKLALTTCPGATEWCKVHCYAQRIKGVVEELYAINSRAGDDVPDLPSDARLCRPHVSGDFDSVGYIKRWEKIIRSRLDVQFWCYTRSWRIPEFLPHLEVIQSLPNMQMFASMDASTTQLPPSWWRIAWIDGDDRINHTTALVCPEERGKVENCEKCKYCFQPVKKLRDVVFLKH